MNEIDVFEIQTHGDLSLFAAIQGIKFRLHYYILATPRAQLYIYAYKTFDDAVSLWRKISVEVNLPHEFVVWNIENFDNVTRVDLIHSYECDGGYCVFLKRDID